MNKHYTTIINYLIGLYHLYRWTACTEQAPRAAFFGDDLLPRGCSEHWPGNIHKEGCVPVVTGTAAASAATIMALSRLATTCLAFDQRHCPKIQ
jgi:hypothetical protein